MINPTLFRAEVIGPLLKGGTKPVYVLTITFDGETESYEFDSRDEALDVADRLVKGLRGLSGDEQSQP